MIKYSLVGTIVKVQLKCSRDCTSITQFAVEQQRCSKFNFLSRIDEHSEFLINWFIITSAGSTFVVVSRFHHITGNTHIVQSRLNVFDSRSRFLLQAWHFCLPQQQNLFQMIIDA
ncbi:unnamed protein product [Haemonchus placei]|uniref:Uncharacterized protein n=1 Tax=Haemonchus placei TaxID=6290 RepID=A0A0N4WFL6_HAEPC|nr:unnamed protein product [Haemonchus placei]